MRKGLIICIGQISNLVSVEKIKEIFQSVVHWKFHLEYLDFREPKTEMFPIPFFFQRKKKKKKKNITKTRPFKYVENFTTKKWQFFT